MVRVLGLSLVAAVSALAIGSAAIAAPPTVGCGSVITENTRLTTNLKGCTDGLVLAGNGVTLDLAGHVIAGVGGSVGINVTGQGATVKNGVITGFGTGIFAAPATPTSPSPSVRLKTLLVLGNTVGVLLDRLGNDAAASTIDTSAILGNTTFGVAFDRTNLALTNSIVRGNGSHGVNELEAVGLFRNNDISQNGGDGIFASDVLTSTGGLFGNNLSGNGGNGYEYRQSHGDAYPRLANNRADRNTQLGFFLSGNGGSLSNLDGGGNSARRNGDARQCVVQDATQAIAANALVCRTGP
jgi:hypothetical protein